MANKDLFKQAIAEAKSVREAAIANAKEALEESLTPHLKDMLAAKLQEMDDSSADEEVVKEIDGNTAKLEKHEPRFYSITVSPSKYELRKLQNSSEDLKRYTRELMKDYVASFNREIKGRPVSIEDIKYYAKIEHQRTFKGTDFQVKENHCLLYTSDAADE